MLEAWKKYYATEDIRRGGENDFISTDWQNPEDALKKQLQYIQEEKEKYWNSATPVRWLQEQIKEHASSTLH